MKWKLAIGVAAILCGLVLLIMVLFPPAMNLAAMNEPAFAMHPAETMLVVRAEGDPELVAAKAFMTLFRAWYRVPGVSRGHAPAPRARWPRSTIASPRSGWVGLYALPVPAGTTTPPPGCGPEVSVQQWTYGRVAELVHHGPYDMEQPTIERLEAFIRDHHAAIVGDHEEEYVRGPGAWFKGNPNHYLTIIRLHVR